MPNTTRAMQVMILRMPASRCLALMQKAAQNILYFLGLLTVRLELLWFMRMKGISMFQTTRGTWNERLKI